MTINSQGKQDSQTLGFQLISVCAEKRIRVFDLPSTQLQAFIKAEAPDGGTTVGSSSNFVNVRTC